VRSYGVSGLTKKSTKQDTVPADRGSALAGVHIHLHLTFPPLQSVGRLQNLHKVDDYTSNPPLGYIKTCIYSAFYFCCAVIIIDNKNVIIYYNIVIYSLAEYICH